MRHRSPQRVIADIGRRIAELREARGWTQERFAEVLRIAPQNVARLEQGRADFRVSTLVRVARVLGADARALWEIPLSRKPRKPGRPKKATTTSRTRES